MIKPKFEDFDYGEGRKDLSWCQYAKALEEYVTFLQAQDPTFRQSLVVGRSEQLKQKFTQGQNVTVLSGEKPLLTSIKFVEWDELNGDWKYYFDDEDGKQWFGHECEMEAR